MPLLQMQGICKSFNGISVLDNVSLQVKTGEVHALLGENGAGKSTLMNILTGSLRRDKGSIVFNGEHIEDNSIKQTEEKGIAFVHQELNLFNDLKVFENIFINKELTGFLGHLRKRDMISQCKELFLKLNVNIDPNVYVSSLKTSEKQLLEISKALFFKAKLLILDEPTTSLNQDEVAHLFEIVNALKKDGISFIFISHKMPEIFEYADSYTIFRNGQYIDSGAIKDTSPLEVTSKMVGKEQNNLNIYKKRDLGEVVLELDHLSGMGFNEVSFKARRGEIIGMTGLQGCGSSEVMQCIFGINPKISGDIRVKCKSIFIDSIHKAMRNGIALLPANRKENSVIPDLSILENMYIAEHTLSASKFHIQKDLELKRYQKQKNALSIKAQDPKMSILSLSGGNQQKVFIARWLNTNADILLFDNPNQGIDVGAKAEIYKLILDLAKSGKTILVNTLEIPELQKVADLCLVFFKGKVVKVLEHDEIDEHKIMMYSTNSMS